MWRNHLSFLTLLLLITSCTDVPKEPPVTASKTCQTNLECPTGQICQNSECKIPVICGDGVIGGDEKCDDGNTDSYDGCDNNCQPEEGTTITLMNWNILFGNYAFTSSVYKDGTTFTYTRDFSPAGGAAPTPPRAEAMGKALATLDELPAIINVMEMDPSWKLPENFGYLEQHGYRMLYPNTPFMLTQLIYRPEQLTLIKKGFVNLTSRWSGLGPVMKTAVTYGVFQEKRTNEIFIALSTHWDPNDGVSTKNGLGGAMDALYINELDRIAEAKESIDLVQKLLQEFPTAHIFYGGDFNTVDFDIVYEVIAELFPNNDTSDITIPMIFTMLGASYHPADDFKGSLGYFAANSGLIGSRKYALEQQLAINDCSTTSDAAVVTDILGFELKTPVVIDYNFYSPELQLQSYQVMNEGDFSLVSDHLPVMVKFKYYPRSQANIHPQSYPDDSGTDLYVPIPDYQGPVFSLDED